jgi:hypothetical protein
MRILLTLFSLTIFISGFGQNFKPVPPNYDLIEKEIKKTDSDFYYPKLMQRYRDNDTTLTHEEYRHLYYGYLFNDSYEPYWLCDCIDTLAPIYSKAEWTPQDCDTIIKYGKMCCDDFPFDLRQINMIAYAYHIKGHEDEAILWSYKVHNIIGTIFSTGNGEKPKKAWHVISTSHEYEIIKSFGLFPAGQALIKGNYDLINISPNQYGVTKFYFNIEKLFQANMKSFNR